MLRASTQTFQYWHLVTTSLASDTGQRDGRCVQTGGQDSQMTEFTTITTDSELTIPGFRERAQDAQPTNDKPSASRRLRLQRCDRGCWHRIAHLEHLCLGSLNRQEQRNRRAQANFRAFVLQLSRSCNAVHVIFSLITASLHFTAEPIQPRRPIYVLGPPIRLKHLYRDTFTAASREIGPIIPWRAQTGIGSFIRVRVSTGPTMAQEQLRLVTEGILQSLRPRIHGW
jgi:hypothetical protein